MINSNGGDYTMDRRALLTQMAPGTTALNAPATQAQIPGALRAGSLKNGTFVDPNRGVIMTARSAVPRGDVGNTGYGGGIAPVHSGPYEAPEAHPGAGGVSGPDGWDVGQWGSEGPGGLDGHMQEHMRDFEKWRAGQGPSPFGEDPNRMHDMGPDHIPGPHVPRLDLPGRGPIVQDPNRLPGEGVARGPVETPPAAAPAAPSDEGGWGGGMAGMEASKFHDANYHSPKYDFGRITTGIGLQALMTPEGKQKYLAALQANPAFKDARLIGDDKVQYTGHDGRPVVIDYIEGAKSSHPRLNYGLQGPGGGGGGGGAAAGGGALPVGGGGPLGPSYVPTDNGFFQKLLQTANGSVEGGLDRDAILKLLAPPPGQATTNV